ncbi:MAG TPA: NADH-quinone oxidoreductase subunit M [Candidatus Limnocylindria bacterium]|nr:NADH-quinone oxidoreductase subunit M [Candidatus Limnocylindria bacterium]
MSLLTSIILVPFLGALVVALIPRNYRFVIRVVALASTLVSMLLAVAMFVKFDSATAANGFKFVQQIPWVQSLGISYYVGVDGINVGLILMGAIVAFATACVSNRIETQVKEFYLLLLVMVGGILGAFASLDLFFFYFFHELALVPTFIMIGVWGRGELKNYATFQITLYLSVGALIALIGLIILYINSAVGGLPATFDIVEMTRRFKAVPMALGAQKLIFPLLLFGFGILVSLWPFHTWAPLGYGSAPAATSMLHAGVLKKFGLYGLIRIALPLAPEGAKLWLHVITWLALGNILYCGWVAMRQRDFNFLLGNSSVAHMGFCFLGIASLSLIGITGTVLVMIAHGLLAALSFGLSGYLNEQAGTLEISKLGGLLKKMPFIGTALIMAAMAGCGLPGFANFPGELLTLFGAWKTLPTFVVVAAWGALVVGAIYMLRAVRNILHGPVAENLPAITDASLWRKVPFALLLASLILFGVAPRLLTSKIEPAVKEIVAMANGKSPIAEAPKRAAVK